MKNIITLIISIILSGGGTWIFKDFKCKYEKKQAEKSIKDKLDSIVKFKRIVFVQKQKNDNQSIVIDSLKDNIILNNNTIGQLQFLLKSQNQSIIREKKKVDDCENMLCEAIASGVVRRDTVEKDKAIYLNVFGKPSKRNKKL